MNAAMELAPGESMCLTVRLGSPEHPQRERVVYVRPADLPGSTWCAESVVIWRRCTIRSSKTRRLCGAVRPEFFLPALVGDCPTARVGE